MESKIQVDNIIVTQFFDLSLVFGDKKLPYNCINDQIIN